MRQFGIDISRWQRGMSLAQAQAEGVTFAIIKAGGGDDGLYKDSQFDQFYAQAKAIGMPVGAYFFGKAMTKERAAQEADKFLEILSGHQLEMPVYYDVEGKMLENNKDLLTDIIIAFCQRVEDAGYFSGFYTGAWALNNQIDDKRLAHFCHWVASWTKSKPKLKSGNGIGMWQFGGSTNLIRDTHIAGMVCDQDYCYQDYTEAIKRLGLNGFGKQPQKKTCTVTAGVLNCRQQPTTASAIVGAFKSGTTLTVLEETSADWWKVSGPCYGTTIIGYCARAYLV